MNALFGAMNGPKHVLSVVVTVSNRERARERGRHRVSQEIVYVRCEAGLRFNKDCGISVVQQQWSTT